MIKMNKILLITIIGLLLVGTIFVGAKLVKGDKIKSIKEIDCNKKLDEDCNKKIKIKDDNPLRIDLINDTNTGKEVMHIYSLGN